MYFNISTSHLSDHIVSHILVYLRYLWFPKVTLHLNIYDSLPLVILVTISVIYLVLPLNMYMQMVQNISFSPIRHFLMPYQWDSSGKNILHFLSLLYVFE